MKIIAKTRKAQQRVKLAGSDEVTILRRAEHLPMGPGPWTMVAFGKHTRWVHAADKDFALQD